MRFHSETTRSRAGISLLEAMIAIGVMAIGLLSLLTLFPLGAIQIGQALKDDRCSETALQADAYLRQYWRHAVINAQPVGTVTDTTLRDPDDAGPLHDCFTQPEASYPLAPATEPSYPVLIDPIGWHSYLATMHDHLAGIAAPTGIPRRNLAGISDGNLAVRVCTLPDDLTFERDGQATVIGGNLQRQGKYHWAAVLQRQRTGLSDRANLKILVFDGRPPLLNLPGNEFQLSVSTGTVVPGVTSSIEITSLPTSEIPLLRRGGWIMDGTLIGGIRHANFYRIAAVNSPTPGKYTIDLEKPIVRTDGGTGTYDATFYLLVGLAEVFDRPPLLP